ncbi:hypothetical protein GGR08_001001 [Bartonella fuyuanensis]|uniref:Cytochrome c-type biogenesis protein DsbD, protein-disulfide reductase n=1 Tax=Bartonella fuyuanensis TaxID=1460968 RepID=A0A840DYV5_9HYPH|nr:hypothetical protein [Bartonella fuyuanensis]MBB4076695.1 hypothetical protein [Bartonella fuyuanensis]
MINIFKTYVFSIFIASTFFLSQIVNVNANYSRKDAPKEEFSVSLMEKAKNIKSDAVSRTAFYFPSVSYETVSEGKVEKVVDPTTIGVGLLVAGYAISFIGSLISWIKDLVLIFR